ncbi:MAG: TlpA family protein disulfide reductase [Thermomicrobiales bacterium]
MVTTVQTGTHLGEPSPDWALPRLDGGELGPSAVRGTKTLFFFWASW